MKNKIKMVSVILALVILIPNIALASWWNPFSWNIFHKKEIPVTTKITNAETPKTSEEKINELQKQIDDLKSPQTVSTPIKAVPTIKEIKKVTPTVQSNKVTTTTQDENNTLICNGQKILDTCPSLGKKFFCGPNNTSGCYTQKELDTLRICNGKSYDISNCSSQNPFYCPETGNASCGKPSQTSSTSSAYDSLLKSIKDREDAAAKEESDRHNSPECLSAKRAYDNISKQISDNAALIENVEVGSPEAAKLYSQGADLAIKSNSINSTYYRVCENYIATPQKTTTCTFIGNTMTCR